METILNNKKIVGIIASCIVIVCVCASIIMAYGVDAIFVDPEPNQYFELRAVEVKEVEGQNKQVIMELWGYDIEFKRI